MKNYPYICGRKNNIYITHKKRTTQSVVLLSFIRFDF